MKTVKMKVSPVTAAFFAIRDKEIQDANPNERERRMDILLTAIATRMQVQHKSGCSYTYCYDRENDTFSYTEREYFWTIEQRQAAAFAEKKEFVFTFPSNDEEHALSYSIVLASTENEARTIARAAYGSKWAFCYLNPEEAGVGKYGLVLRDYLEA